MARACPHTQQRVGTQRGPAHHELVLSRVADTCIREPHSHLAVFVMQRGGRGHLDFIQNMEYKFVELLSCAFVASDDEVRCIWPLNEHCARSELAASSAASSRVGPRPPPALMATHPDRHSWPPTPTATCPHGHPPRPPSALMATHPVRDLPSWPPTPPRVPHSRIAAPAYAVPIRTAGLSCPPIRRGACRSCPPPPIDWPNRRRYANRSRTVTTPSSRASP